MHGGGSKDNWANVQNRTATATSEFPALWLVSCQNDSWAILCKAVQFSIFLNFFTRFFDELGRTIHMNKWIWSLWLLGFDIDVFSDLTLIDLVIRI